MNHIVIFLFISADEDHFDSSRVRRFSDHEANAARRKVLAVKSTLLHALGNAGHETSRDLIMEHARANHGHHEIRHTAVKALRKFDCKEVTVVA